MSDLALLSAAEIRRRVASGMSPARRSSGRTSTASPAWSPESTPSSSSPPSVPSPPHGASTPPCRRLPAPGPRRRPARGQGRAARPRPPHHLRLPHPRGLPPPVHRDRRGAARGGGSDRGREDEHGRVRHGLLHRGERLQADPQPVGRGRGSPAARRAGRPRRSPRAWFPSPWAPTPAAPSGSPPRCAASWASSRPGAASAATAWSPSLPRSTRPARSPAPSRTWPSPLALCSAPTPATPRASPGRPRPRRRGLSRRRRGFDRRALGLPRGRGRSGDDGPLPRVARRARVRRARRSPRRPFPHLPHAVAAYYLVATAEASSNLARYDGVRYGPRAPGEHDLAGLYGRTRDIGFGAEVKRRILLGTFALSSGYYDAYYLRGPRRSENAHPTRLRRGLRRLRRDRDADDPHPRLPPRREDGATPWRCTSPTSSPCPRTSPASPRCRSPAASPGASPSACSSSADPSRRTRSLRAGAAYQRLTRHHELLPPG
jgi:hypothetical protein